MQNKNSLSKSDNFEREGGGDYRTRICDLLRVQSRMEIKSVLLCPFDTVLPGRGCSLERLRPLFPSARFGVWVAVWVSA